MTDHTKRNEKLLWLHWKTMELETMTVAELKSLLDEWWNIFTISNPVKLPQSNSQSSITNDLDD